MPTQPECVPTDETSAVPTRPERVSIVGNSAVPAPTGARRTAGAVLLGVLGHGAVVGVVLAAARAAVADAGGDLEAGGRFAVFYSSVCLLLSGQMVLVALVAWGAAYGGAGWRRGLWAGWALGLALLILWIASW